MLPICEVLETDSIAAGIGEWNVGSPRLRKLCIQFDRIPDIDNNEKRRTAFCRWQGTGVLIRLAKGTLHCIIPGFCPPRCRASLAALLSFLESVGKGLFLQFLLDALLGFENKTATFVEVEITESSGTVSDMKRDCLIIHVRVFILVRRGWVRPGNFKNIAQLIQKRLIIPSFRSPGWFPAFNELLNGYWFHICVEN